MSTKNVVLIAIVAALYAVLTIALAPISYGAIQFRVSEILKILVLYNPLLAIGIGIGTFIGNMASPFAGPWDLIWMPLTDIAGGLLAWSIFQVLGKRFAAIPMIVYALTTGAAVGLMLTFFGMGGFLILAGGVALSESIVLLAGLPLIHQIIKALDLRGFDIRLQLNHNER